MAKIIIVEDEAIVAMANKMMLASLRHEIIASTSSAEQAVQESSSGDADLILMDIKLKGAMDGIQAAEEIRKSKSTPILFITGNSDVRTKQRIGNISNASVLQKPIMVEDLRMAINKLIHTN